MDFRYLYTSFDGRIGRKHFWLSFVLIFLAAIIVLTVLGFLAQSQPGVVSVLGLLINLILLYPMAALGVKRLHDRGRSGRLMWVILVPGMLSQLAQTLGLSVTEQEIGGQFIQVPNVLGMVLALVAFIVALWALVELGFRKGTAGDNAYGPDPLETT